MLLLFLLVVVLVVVVVGVVGVVVVVVTVVVCAEPVRGEDHVGVVAVHRDDGRVPLRVHHVL